MRTLVLALAILAPAVPAGAQQPASQVQVEQALVPVLRIKGRTTTRTLADRMRELGVPAVSIAVLRGGEIEWAKAYGLRQTDPAVPADESTLFQAASISKPVAALGMLRLVAAGSLALDTDVNAFLRRWRLPPSDSAPGAVVTLRQLASHTAGTTVSGFPGYHPDSALPDITYVLDGRAPANTPPVRVAMMPGKAFQYSGGGTTVEQLAIEDASGRDFTEFMEHEVLRPLGMRRSTYAQPLPAASWANAATGYRAGGAMVEGRAHAYPEQAAAGLWTTPSDLARMLLHVRRMLLEQSDFLPGAVAAQMLKRQAGGPVGIGFFVQGEGDSLRLGHGGANEGYRAQVWLYRDSGDGAVIMTNSDEGLKLIGEILATVALANGWKGFVAPAVVPRPVPVATLDAYVGEYGAERFPPVTIAREGDGLVFQMAGDRPLPMVPLGPEEFWLAEAAARVRFPGAPKAIERMEVELPGLSVSFTRRRGD